MIKINTNGTIAEHANRFCEKAFGAKTIQSAALKLAEEAGEVCGSANKMIEGRANMQDLRDEIGDALILLLQLCSLSGITMQSAIYWRFREIVNRMISADFSRGVPDTPMPKKFPDPPEGFSFVGPAPVFIREGDDPEDILTLDITRPNDGWFMVEEYRPAEFWMLYAARSMSDAYVRMIGHTPTEATEDILAGILEKKILETFPVSAIISGRIKAIAASGNLRTTIVKSMRSEYGGLQTCEWMWGAIDAKNAESTDTLDRIGSSIATEFLKKMASEIFSSCCEGGDTSS